MGVNIEICYIDLDVYLDRVNKTTGWDKSQVEAYCREFGPVLRTEDETRRVLVLLNDEYHDGYSPYYNLSDYLCHQFKVSKDAEISEGGKSYGDFLFDLLLYPAKGVRYYEGGPFLLGANLELFDRNKEPDCDFEDEAEDEEL